MKTIGIKLADGTFYPVLEEGTPKQRMLDLTTAKDNQTKVQIDLYRSENGTMEDAEYVDTLEVTKLNPHPNGEPELHLSVGLDEENNLTAEVVDPETGKKKIYDPKYYPNKYEGKIGRSYSDYKASLESAKFEDLGSYESISDPEEISSETSISVEQINDISGEQAQDSAPDQV